jgi:hypothetical protein
MVFRKKKKAKKKNCRSAFFSFVAQVKNRCTDLEDHQVALEEHRRLRQVTLQPQPQAIHLSQAILNNNMVATHRNNNSKLTHHNNMVATHPNSSNNSSITRLNNNNNNMTPPLLPDKCKIFR